MNFITFLEVNGLKQKDLAQFLGGVDKPALEGAQWPFSATGCVFDGS